MSSLQLLSAYSLLLALRNAILDFDVITPICVTIIAFILSLRVSPINHLHIEFRVAYPEYFKKPRCCNGIVFVCASIGSIIALLALSKSITDMMLNPEGNNSCITGIWQYMSNFVILRRYAEFSDEIAPNKTITLTYVKELYYVNVALVWFLLQQILQEDRLATLLKMRARR